jgi:hypothetical protein
VWARGSRAKQRQLQQQPNAVAALLTGDEQQQLRQLCGRVLYHTLSSSVRIYGAGAHHAFVATGDIPDEWIRDSSVQLGVYLPRITAHPSLRQVGRTSAAAAAGPYPAAAGSEAPPQPASMLLFLLGPRPGRGAADHAPSHRTGD